LFICKRGKEQKAAASLDAYVEDELQTQAIWDETPNEIRFRVRDPEEFEKGSFRRKSLEGIEGVAIIMGRLKKEHVQEGHDPRAMVLQAYRFPSPTLPHSAASPRSWPNTSPSSPRTRP